MEPPAGVEKVKAEIWKYGENMNIKCKVNAVRNARMTLNYMEDTEPGYSWTNYTAIEDQTEILEDNFDWNQVSKGNMGKGDGQATLLWFDLTL